MRAKKTKTRTPWPESMKKLHQPSHLSEKLVPTFLRIRGCHVVKNNLHLFYATNVGVGRASACDVASHNSLPCKPKPKCNESRNCKTRDG
jgi:hypothetical protein